MIIYPAEWNARKAAVFGALAQADGGGRRLWTIPWSLRGFPETEARVAACLARARRQPQGFWRWGKQWLIRLQCNGARRLFMAAPGAVAVVWNGLGGSRQAFQLAAREAGCGVLCCELAPFADRVTVDPLGVNAESSAIGVDFAGWAGADADRCGEGWRALAAGMTARASLRADVRQAADAPQGRYLFCPLQVPGDSQVTLFAGWSSGMAGFLAALGQAAAYLPQGWHLRVKEHPSARASLAEALAALNGAFATADSLTFEPALRARFMNWLDRVYYPGFTFPPGSADSSAMAEKLRQARKLAANAAQPLSPPPPLCANSRS